MTEARMSQKHSRYVSEKNFYFLLILIWGWKKFLFLFSYFFNYYLFLCFLSLLSSFSWEMNGKGKFIFLLLLSFHFILFFILVLMMKFRCWSLKKNYVKESKLFKKVSTRGWGWRIFHYTEFVVKNLLIIEITEDL